MCEFVVKIVALIENMFVNLGQKDGRFSPAMAALLPPGHLTLGPTQLGLGFAKPARIVVDFPVAGYGKAFQGHVDADGALLDGQTFVFYDTDTDTDKASISAIVFPFEGDRLGPPGHGTV